MSNHCGMTFYMFLTPDQTRFFCVLRKARIKRNNNGRIERTMTMYALNNSI